MTRSRLRFNNEKMRNVLFGSEGGVTPQEPRYGCVDWGGELRLLTTSVMHKRVRVFLRLRQ